MASRKPTSGPGRGAPRTRSTARPGERSARPVRRLSAETSQRPRGGATVADEPRSGIGIGLTRRFIVLAVVSVILLLSVSSSLRVYHRQERQLGEARSQIAEHDARIAELSNEVERWRDKNYVAAQARERLGWVMPGEVGFRVLGPDGKPLGGGSTIHGPANLPAGEHHTTWWERLDGSISAADAPLPGSPQDQSTPAPEITASSSSRPSGAASSPSSTPTR